MQAQVPHADARRVRRNRWGPAVLSADTSFDRLCSGAHTHTCRTSAALAPFDYVKGLNSRRCTTNGDSEDSVDGCLHPGPRPRTEAGGPVAVGVACPGSSAAVSRTGGAWNEGAGEWDARSPAGPEVGRRAGRTPPAAARGDGRAGDAGQAATPRRRSAGAPGARRSGGSFMVRAIRPPRPCASCAGPAPGRPGRCRRAPG